MRPLTPWLQKVTHGGEPGNEAKLTPDIWGRLGTRLHTIPQLATAILIKLYSYTDKVLYTEAVVTCSCDGTQAIMREAWLVQTIHVKHQNISLKYRCTDFNLYIHVHVSLLCWSTANAFWYCFNSAPCFTTYCLSGPLHFTPLPKRRSWVSTRARLMVSCKRRKDINVIGSVAFYCTVICCVNRCYEEQWSCVTCSIHV